MVVASYPAVIHRFATSPFEVSRERQAGTMHTWIDDRVEEIRQRLTPLDEGSLWMLLLDDVYGEPIMAAAIDNAMAELDWQLTRKLAEIITQVPAKAVLLAIPRRTGQAQAADRQLWADLVRLLGPPSPLADLVVIGESDYWSARDASGPGET